jgi:hypothetical protein
MICVIVGPRERALRRPQVLERIASGAIGASHRDLWPVARARREQDENRRRDDRPAEGAIALISRKTRAPVRGRIAGGSSGSIMTRPVSRSP